MNYLSRILSDLAAGSWVCPAEGWLDDGILTYSQRISEENHARARAKRPLIESRRCRRHAHPRSWVYEYRDSEAAAPKQTPLRFYDDPEPSPNWRTPAK